MIQQKINENQKNDSIQFTLADEAKAVHEISAEEMLLFFAADDDLY